MSERIPLELAELLHVTLGALGDVLEQEGHAWAPMVQRVVNEYTRGRDGLIAKLHGSGVFGITSLATAAAINKMQDLIDASVSEATDFAEWDSEVEGETAE